MATGEELDETDRQLVLEILAEQKRRIEEQTTAAIRARSLISERIGTAAWTGESHAAFTVSAAELINELDGCIVHLRDALEECDRATRHVNALAAETPMVRAGAGV
ncbi:hypothetical protein GCM10027416_30860 [Okibacterium endophyticum]